MLFWLEPLPGGIKVGIGDVNTSKDVDEFDIGVYEIELEWLASGKGSGLDVFWLEELVNTVEGGVSKTVLDKF